MFNTANTRRETLTVATGSAATHRVRCTAYYVFLEYRVIYYHYHHDYYYHYYCIPTHTYLYRYCKKIRNAYEPLTVEIFSDNHGLCGACQIDLIRSVAATRGRDEGEKRVFLGFFSAVRKGGGGRWEMCSFVFSTYLTTILLLEYLTQSTVPKYETNYTFTLLLWRNKKQTRFMYIYITYYTQ